MWYALGLIGLIFSYAMLWSTVEGDGERLVIEDFPQQKVRCYVVKEYHNTRGSCFPYEALKHWGVK